MSILRLEAEAAVLDALDEPFYRVDEAWRFTWVNRAFETYFDLSRADTLGRVLWDIIPIIGTVFERNLRRAMSERVEVVFRAPTRTHTGHTIEAKAFPVGDGLAVNFRDVTGALRLQAEAHAQLEELQAIYANAPIGMALLDVDLRYRRVNAALAEINAMSIENHIGRTLAEIVPDIAQFVEPMLRAVKDTGRAVSNIEIPGRLSLPQAAQRTWLGSIAPVHDDAGVVNGLLVTVQEITERKAAETQRQALLSEMNHRVKNNFQMVANMLEQQARRSDLDAVRDQLHEAMRRVHVLAELHASLSMDGDPGMIDFGAYLGVLCEKLQAAIADPARIRLTFQADPAEIPTEKALPLGFVVNEVVTNAIKYAFDDGAAGQIRVRFTRLEEGYRLTIQDNGRGLAQVRRGGPGLGMRLVEAFVAQIGGKLSLGHEGGLSYEIVLPA